MTGLGSWVTMETESLKSGNGFSESMIGMGKARPQKSTRPLPPELVHQNQTQLQHGGGSAGVGTTATTSNRRNRDGSGSRSASALSLSMPLSSRHPARSHHNSTHNIRSLRGCREGREEPLLERSGGSGREEDGTVTGMRLCDYSPAEDATQQTQHFTHENQQQQQDDGWGETGTAVTGNTSDRSVSPTGTNRNTGMKWAQLNTQDQTALPLSWAQRYLGTWMSGVVVLLSLGSPILMVLGPKVGFPSWRPPLGGRECGTECSALLLSLALKMVALGGAVWAIFCRGPPATMPRIFFFRSITLLLAFLATFTFWLFYIVRGEEELSTLGATAFAGGLADALLAVHYLGILLVEVRHLSPAFQISVLRSPDGIERKYLIGRLSIQRAAVFVLQRYYAEFPSYNPQLDRLPPLRRRHNSLTHAPSFKFYQIDGVSSAASMIRSQRGISHNERFYEEQEFERRLRKRRARLIGATEEAFTHIKRRRDQQAGTGVPLDCAEAAAAVFPSLARPLQKYLRLTRQLPWHTAESVLNHLATSLRLGLAPRAFLDKFTNTPTPIHTMPSGGVSSWALVSDVSVSRTLGGKTTFLLRGGEESLFVSVSVLPHFNLTEEVVDPKNNKFTLRLGSETSV